jgi:hypothetical protein
MKKQYKEFNLKEALQGNVEVETTSGRKVKYIHLIENYVGNFPVIVVLESENKGGTDEILNYTVKGTFWYESNASKFDLQMYDKVAVCYVNVYKVIDGRLHVGPSNKTKEQAISSICEPKGATYIKTIEITDQTTEDVSNDDDSYNELGMNDVEFLFNVVTDIISKGNK